MLNVFTRYFKMIEVKALIKMFEFRQNYTEAKLNLKRIHWKELTFLTTLPSLGIHGTLQD